MDTDEPLAAYYRRRAGEYDAFYAEPERQADLAVLRDWVAAETQGRSVLEAACGTGYWTEAAAGTAGSIAATDINAAMLSIASRRVPAPHVAFLRADALNLPDLPQRFDCGMAHLWWSHLRLRQRAAFLSGLAARLDRGARLLMIDETLVPQVGAPICRRDADGDTYQRRRLANGDVFEIVKNYPDAAALHRDLDDACERIQVLQLRHFWAASTRFR